MPQSSAEKESSEEIIQIISSPVIKAAASLHLPALGLGLSRVQEEPDGSRTITKDHTRRKGDASPQHRKGALSPQRHVKPRPKPESSALMKLDLHVGQISDELKSETLSATASKILAEGDIKPHPSITTIDRRQALRQYFDSLDDDASGIIDLKEVGEVLQKVGIDNKAAKKKIFDHFRFMDRDGSGEVFTIVVSPILASRSCYMSCVQVGFEEFVQATIEAESSEHTSLADEKYMSQFGGEIYHFLANVHREKLLKKYEAESSRDDSLWEFLQFQRLAQISQAAVMPFAMTMPAKGNVDATTLNQLKCQRSASILSASGSLLSADSRLDSPSQDETDINAQERKRHRTRVNRRRAEIFAKVKKRGKRNDRDHRPTKWDPAFIHGKKSKSRSHLELQDVPSTSTLPPVVRMRGTNGGRRSRGPAEEISNV